ncbi:MAG: hypothetical protein LIP01_02525 [Tannerellaceae bacterium]|nr:hypothetical protein [Tannerellaceae bacterium]
MINGTAKIGKYCKLHGNICIGNDGLSMEAPIIGDNVDIGVGAKIIGNVKVANNIIIGAGSIVVKDCDKEGVWAGVPSKFLH